MALWTLLQAITILTRQDSQQGIFEIFNTTWFLCRNIKPKITWNK